MDTVQMEQFVMLCSSVIVFSGDTAPQIFKVDWKYIDIKKYQSSDSENQSFMIL